MRTTILKPLGSFRRDETGVTLVEHGIALTLAVVVGTGALRLLGRDVDDEMAGASLVLTTATP